MKKSLNFKGILFALLFFTANFGFAQLSCLSLNASLNAEGYVFIYNSDISIDADTSYISKDSIDFTNSLGFGCDEVGENTVYVINVLDGVEYPCESIITIQDVIAPIAIVEVGFEITLTSAIDTYTLLPSDIDESSYDNCGIVSYTLSMYKSAVKIL